METPNPIDYYEKEPDYSGYNDYYKNIEEEEKRLETEAEREQERFEALTEPLKEIESERGAKVAEATNHDNTSSQISSPDATTPKDRSAEMQEALVAAEKEYGSENFQRMRNGKINGGHEPHYEGHGFDANGVELAVEDRESDYYLPAEAIAALGDIADAIDRFKSAFEKPTPEKGVDNTARSDISAAAETNADNADLANAE